MTSKQNDLVVYKSPVSAPVDSNTTSSTNHSYIPAGSISIPFVIPVKTVSPITPIPTTVTSATSTVATSSPSRPTTVPANQSTLKNTPPVKLSSKRTQATSKSSQTAAVYSALSDTSAQTTSVSVYYWLQNTWHSFLHVLTQIL
jgi:hypothetical protein